MRSSANVKMLTPIDRSSSTISGRLQAEDDRRPVTRPIVSTAGMVRLMLDSAVPSARFMERCS